MIQDLSFSDTVAEEIKKNFSRFPCLKGAEEHPLVNVLSDFSHPPVPYLVRQLEVALEILGISCPMVLSSSLKIPETFKGQDRILEICRILQANRYVNAPSGRDLYEVHAFKKRNIELSFLPLFQGNRVSILERVLTEPAEKIRDEIFKQLKEV